MLTRPTCGAYSRHMAKTIRTSVTLTTPQHEVLKVEADKLGITVADLIRRIVDQWRVEKNIGD